MKKQKPFILFVLSMIVLFVFSCTQPGNNTGTNHTGTNHTDTDNTGTTIVDDNILKNGYFNNGTSNWNLWMNTGGDAAMAVENGELKVTITNPGPNTWNIGLGQTGFRIEYGMTYTLSFYARTDNIESIKSVIQLGHAPWICYSGTNSTDKAFTLTSVMTKYSYTFTMACITDNASDYEFFLGGNGTGNIYFDNIVLKKVANNSTLNSYLQAKKLGKGVNFGNLLDAYPQEGSWANGRTIMESDFDLAKQAGFDSIRIPIRFSNYALFDSPYTINETFMQRVDEVVNWGLSKGLRIIIDMHHYNNDPFVNNDPNHNDIHKYPVENKARFIGMWKQIAARYMNYPGELYYELLNEPSMTVDEWNSILIDCIQAIRLIDSYHTIIIGCANWSNLSGLEGLIIPDDENNAIVTFHYYTPSIFCFQGQAWMGNNYATTGIRWPAPPLSPVTIYDCVNQNSWEFDQITNYNTIDSDQNICSKAIVQTEIEKAYNWGIANNRPLWMGEFTAQDGADITSRANWTKFVREELEMYNISWSTWTLLSDSHSYIYDVTTNKWIIELTNALGLTVSN